MFVWGGGMSFNIGENSVVAEEKKMAEMRVEFHLKPTW